jgi:HD-GYP domain-containing protein (c-di-GMP phosphodiesterase class II)
MVQTRPYRKGLDREQALAVLTDLARQGRLELELVTLAASCGEDAMTAALAGV